MTRNYSEKSLNSILDYVSTSQQVLHLMHCMCGALSVVLYIGFGFFPPIYMYMYIVHVC